MTNKLVIVSVVGGVADIVQAPEDVNVIILDYDNGQHVCPNCHKDIGDTFWCPFCDTQLTVIKCPSCEQEMAEGQSCDWCGHIDDKERS